MNGGFWRDEPVPALRRETLFDGWPDLGSFYDSLRMSMPADAPMALGNEEYADILAYLLSVNGFPQGAGELPADLTDLRRIQLNRIAR